MMLSSSNLWLPKAGVAAGKRKENAKKTTTTGGAASRAMAVTRTVPEKVRGVGINPAETGF